MGQARRRREREAARRPVDGRLPDLRDGGVPTALCPTCAREYLALPGLARCLVRHIAATLLIGVWA